MKLVKLEGTHPTFEDYAGLWMYADEDEYEFWHRRVVTIDGGSLHRTEGFYANTIDAVSGKRYEEVHTTYLVRPESEDLYSAWDKLDKMAECSDEEANQAKSAAERARDAATLMLNEYEAKGTA